MAYEVIEFYQVHKTIDTDSRDTESSGRKLSPVTTLDVKTVCVELRTRELNLFTRIC